MVVMDRAYGCLLFGTNLSEDGKTAALSSISSVATGSFNISIPEAGQFFLSALAGE